MQELSRIQFFVGSYGMVLFLLHSRAADKVLLWLLLLSLRKECLTGKASDNDCVGTTILP